jgi:two-component system sensor histidine kinase BaeS
VVVRTASHAVAAIRQEQGRALATDNQIYTTLLEWAATHPTWKGVEPTLETLAQHTDRRVALLTPDRTPIADSASGPLPSTASAAIDPLSVNPALVPNVPSDRIDANAVGPFRLPDNEKQYLNALAQRALNCVLTRGGTGRIVTTPTGRPRVESPEQVTAAGCSEALNTPTKTEQVALTQLSALVNGCLARNNLAPVDLALDRSWRWQEAAPADPSQESTTDKTVATCIDSARREQLTPYVAPAAQLFVTTPTGAPQVSPFNLSAGNTQRVVLAAAAVLAATVAVTALAGRRLTKPLRALTKAAEHMRDGSPGARVEVKGRDEIAKLAATFNEMSASRDRIEQQRKDMVGDIAHELRTPLSNIRGWLEATEDGVTKADPALITSLLEEAKLLQHIIDDLQDLAQADAGTLRLHKEEVNLQDLLEQVKATHSQEIEVSSPPLTIRADPIRLRQLLGNLVTNAVRHTPPTGKVTVSARQEAKEIVLEVSDTGTGIAKEDLPHVFDRFWRAEKSRSRATGGSGLGLAIVRKLAEAHQGTATATSTPGKGSTFQIRLPTED